MKNYIYNNIITINLRNITKTHLNIVYLIFIQTL
jgi:hypothetical protein